MKYLSSLVVRCFPQIMRPHLKKIVAVATTFSVVVGVSICLLLVFGFDSSKYGMGVSATGYVMFGIAAAICVWPNAFFVTSLVAWFGLVVGQYINQQSRPQ